MGYRLVQAVFVVGLGRLGDMFGRVRIYNAGFAVFTFASMLLSFDPFLGANGALWLIGWRFLQAIGGSMLMANSAAILTDAFPEDQRGFALGINQVAGLAGQFIGLVPGVCWPPGTGAPCSGSTCRSASSGRCGPTTACARRVNESGGRMDWWGNGTFAVGLGALLVAITIGIQPYHGHAMGWTSPEVLVLLFGGLALLVRLRPDRDARWWTRCSSSACSASGPSPREHRQLRGAAGPGRAAVHARDLAAGDLAPAARLRLQLDAAVGGHLPAAAHGRVPRRGPAVGHLSDRFGARGFATAGMLVYGPASSALMLLPVDFSYSEFAVLIAINGIGIGMFSAPNTSSMMSSVPADQRGAASGMRATFQNSGTALSIGVFFSLLIAGLAGSLPTTLTKGLEHQGVAHAVAHHIARLPPVASLFAAVLGVNPVQHLLSLGGHLSSLPAEAQRVLTGREFFPHLLSAPFHTA